MVVGLVSASLRPSRGCRSNLYFSDTVLHLRVQNIILHAGEVSGTYWAGILGSRPWIRMYVTHHQKEQELCTVWSSA